MAKVNFKYGTLAQYNAIAAKDGDTLYFITDKSLIYKGNVPFGAVVTATATGSGATEGETITIINQTGAEVTFTVPTSAALAAVKTLLEGQLTTHEAAIGDHTVKGHVGLSDDTDKSTDVNDGMAATPKAVSSAIAIAKAYTDSKLGDLTQAMVFKGTIGSASATPTETTLPAIKTAGWTYRVVTAGTYGDEMCEIGDMIVAVKTVTDAAEASNKDWTVVQNNIDGAVFSSAGIGAGKLVVGVNGSRAVAAFANGSAGQVLGIDSGGNLAWTTPSGGGSEWEAI